MYTCPHVRIVPVIIVRFWLQLKFRYRFSQSTQISNFMETGPVGADLFHADGHDEAPNSRLPQLNKRNYKRSNIWV